MFKLLQIKYTSEKNFIKIKVEVKIVIFNWDTSSNK